MKNFSKKKFEMDATALDVSKVFCLSLKQGETEQASVSGLGSSLM
jgi:hypothetical protein